MQLNGQIVTVLPTEERNGFKSRQLILRTVDNPSYPQEISVQFIKDKCDELNQYQPNQQVTIECNLKGRKWTNPQGVDQWFNTIEGWKITAVGQPKQQPNYGNQQPNQQQGGYNNNQQQQGFPQQQNFNNNGQGF